MGQGVGQQVGEQLGDLAAVHGHRLGQDDVAVDPALGLGDAQFAHHLFQGLAQGRIGLAVNGEAAAQPSASEVQHVVDQSGHAQDAVLH